MPVGDGEAQGHYNDFGDAMTYRGHVRNGQILLDDPVQLPEGAQVNVALVADANGADGGAAAIVRARRARRVRLDPEMARQIGTLPEFGPDET
jgi:hypothetical protein